MCQSVLHLTGRAVIFGLLVTALACGYSNPMAPSSGSSSAPGPEGAVIALGSSGLSPGAVTIATGQSVTFVNNDSVAHEIASGPASSYDQCPAINRVGRLEPGQRNQTGALTGRALVQLPRFDADGRLTMAGNDYGPLNHGGTRTN